MEIAFWVCLALIAYPYAIYPAFLMALNRLLGRRLPEPPSFFQPSVSFILPVHNEAAGIAAKIRNLLELEYPAEQLQILVVGDGCTDLTLPLAEAAGDGRVIALGLSHRAGKAAALNLGLSRADGEVVVFTDAGILLERSSLRRMVAHFVDSRIGCVSGEDCIANGGGEGLYARLEMQLRREEGRLFSIAGASGCFYAQRRSLCRPFLAGMAPDFLSVLNTVVAGTRAISEPASRGHLATTTSTKAEFSRKVRTYLRGITAMFANVRLLNPIRYPAFSFILISHKLMRWLAPLSLLGCLLTAWLLRDQLLYAGLLAGQLVFYAIAIAGICLPALSERLLPVRVSAFFLLVNVAALKALALWGVGSRQELWEPTRRSG